jgi:hypothetical protein
MPLSCCHSASLARSLRRQQEALHAHAMLCRHVSALIRENIDASGTQPRRASMRAGSFVVRATSCRPRLQQHPRVRMSGLYRPVRPVSRAGRSSARARAHRGACVPFALCAFLAPAPACPPPSSTARADVRTLAPTGARASLRQRSAGATDATVHVPSRVTHGCADAPPGYACCCAQAARARASLQSPRRVARCAAVAARATRAPLGFDARAHLRS